MALPRRSKRNLKICCGASAIGLIILVVVSVTLVFTVFKPKDPLIKPLPAKLENVQFQLFPTLSLNATMGINATIYNRNYGGFQFKNSTTFVDYRGMNIAAIPLEEGSVPARGKLNISTIANITAEKLVTSPYFWQDFGSGRLNFTSTANLHGKAVVLNVFKFDAKVFSTCDISVQVLSQEVDVDCTAKLKL
ncbi:uncharacterized protein LOC113771660 [Coffea eugenioides]|uniref:Late embryogenesis abundant protein At1g64065-like n=1 Tax=Coffea arabica TaxID=13443 RepID=A0A6P6S3Z6_COFAR|nr:uncharacterized protein LOC113771660 [Coffea eugenioides]